MTPESVIRKAISAYLTEPHATGEVADLARYIAKAQLRYFVENPPASDGLTVLAACAFLDDDHCGQIPYGPEYLPLATQLLLRAETAVKVEKI